MSGTYAPITAKVKNIAFTKDVAVHYTPDGVTWKAQLLSFTSHFGDYDVFGRTVNEQVSQFVTRYSVAGGTYCDNNAGQNYRFTSNLAGGGNVVLYKATARRGLEAGGGFTFVTSWQEGEILVNDLSFAKQVGIRMSADGGVSWNDTQGSFAGDHTAAGVFIGSGAEVWKFKTPTLNLDKSSPEFRFAVSYRNLATGEVFWDNNFGQDYKVGKADGATIG
jgi:hypothetical protein